MQETNTLKIFRNCQSLELDTDLKGNVLTLYTLL